MYLLHLNHNRNIAITDSLCYNYYCSGARVAGRFALETPSNQHNIVLWAKRPPYGDSRPAVRLNTDGNHTEGALIMDIQKEYRTCRECGELFMPTGKGVYCGPVCRSKARSRHTDYWPEEICTCLTCGEEFHPAHSNQHRCRKCIDYGGPQKLGRFVILSRDKFRCIYCGKSSVEDQIELHVDHIIPRARGGTSKASNLVTACQRCNQEKNDGRLSTEAKNRIKEIVRLRNLEIGLDDNKTIKLQSCDVTDTFFVDSIKLDE